MLKEKLQIDLNQALKTGETNKRLVLGMAMTAIKNKELGKRAQMSKSVSDLVELATQSLLGDDEIIEVIASEVKKRREAIDQFNAGQRPELAQKEQAEIDILMAYLPAQLSEEEIRGEIVKIITEIGAKDIKAMGKVISLAMPRLRGKASGEVISRIVKESLG